MSENGASEGREQIEAELMELVKRHEREWQVAPEGDRESARERYVAALEKFNRVVVRGVFPDH